MPYRDLTSMSVERYATLEDLDDRGITIEEREEYEHIVEAGAIVMAGVDYEAILREAEKEADVIVWDGGNNDLPFYRSDLEIVALDPHRLGRRAHLLPRRDELPARRRARHHQGRHRRAGGRRAARRAAAKLNPTRHGREDRLDHRRRRSRAAPGKRVLAIEDGPTVTHGGMAYGAAALAAEAHGAELVDPRPVRRRLARDTFANYPHLTKVLPAVGYSAEQLADLEATIAATPCDSCSSARRSTSAGSSRSPQPSMRATYRIDDAGAPTLDDVVDEFLRERGISI